MGGFDVQKNNDRTIGSTDEGKRFFRKFAFEGKIAEQNETWQEHRYLDMDEFNEWLRAQTEARAAKTVVPLAG